MLGKDFKIIQGSPDQLVSVGIDVGGVCKGFHAVSLKNGDYSGHLATREVGYLVDWCRNTVKAQVIAIDAPCRWSEDDRARSAERALMDKKIWCFSTPARQRALDHPQNHYGWMLQGEALFQSLEATHFLCKELPMSRGAKVCFETFPHAITRHLLGPQASAKKKRAQRKSLLIQAGIDTANLTNIDLIDAALCAYMAHLVGTGAKCVGYGEPKTGLIIAPSINDQYINAK